ncbi:MAG TPA: carbamoyltransferase N-terminal domain-containing protein, partial [Vicinamibacterales bacterium]|nr:carbamoyltransferase N-terminal domain-containing protein [Vicinamibacterales bacterium]
MKHVVLGVSYSYDSGAALLIDGEIVAAINEERLNRIKMYSGFPEQSIVECLRIAGVRPDAVARVAIGGRMNFPYESGVESS